MRIPEPEDQSSFSWRRSILIGLVIFGFLLLALGIAAWISGAPKPLPLDYEGFG